MLIVQLTNRADFTCTAAADDDCVQSKLEWIDCKNEQKKERKMRC